MYAASSIVPEEVITVEDETGLLDSEAILVVSESEYKEQQERDAEIVSLLKLEEEFIDTEVTKTTETFESAEKLSKHNHRTVPFYSQFSDISLPQWQKVGCGIASVAMIIGYYEQKPISVDTLLQKGVEAGSFLSNAGWTHQGLINLTKSYGLDGESIDLSGMSMDAAFEKLGNAIAHSPVMVSVHYTFDPQNPIPHIVVVTDISDKEVFYNDPAEPSGGGSISVAEFQNAWKKRYILIQPV